MHGTEGPKDTRVYALVLPDVFMLLVHPFQVFVCNVNVIYIFATDMHSRHPVDSMTS